MGNKLCAPLLKKNYRGQETNPWHSRKDSHLLRLWADVFRVHGDGDYMRWERVSDDVVPVNISCIEDTPNTVFHVTAYNRQVEKIFDVKITQPGTIICPATECFVHWRDTASHCEWGLNFSTPTDAQRFRDCCSFPTQRFARKASSASSLRLSPPRRQKSKVASASSPSSPIRHSHSVGSDFKSEDGCEHAQGLTVISTSKGTRQQTTSPANPGAQNGGGTHRSQSPPYTYAVIQRRRPQAADDSCVTVVSASNSNNPAFRRSFPSGHVATPSMASVVSSMMSSVKGGQGVATSLPMAASVADKDKSGASSSSNSSVKNASAPPSVTATPTKTTSSSLKLADPQMRPSSAISDLANQKSSSPKHVQISDIVSVNITGTSILNTPTVIHPCADKPNGILKRDNSVRNERTQQIQISSFAGSEDATLPLRRAASPSALPEENPDSRPPKATLRVDTSLAAPQSRSTSSSESPEWPSPPEPLTPQTPQTPNATSQMSFDSDTIQKMLRSLPSSPIDKDYSNDLDLGFHEELNISDDGQLQPQDSNGRRGSRLSRTKSLTVHDRNTKTSSNPRRQQSMDTPGQPVSYQRSEGQKPRMFNKIALEKELKMRNKNIAANYPDSGIGMAVDSGASLRSEGNSAFVKTGKHVSHEPKAGSGGASSESRASEQSDIIRQLGEGSEIRQYLAPDLSDDEGDGSDDSIDTMTETESQMSYARQVGAIRKAGWLVVKNWLLHKKKKIELAPRRTWKRYWVCLKGTTLLFFDCDEESAVTENIIPRHILVIEGGIAQAVPEHPKRDYIFSLSSACGDAYLFQASSQIDLENWIRAIHSACASSYARQHGKDNTLKLLCTELAKLDASIDLDVKMRKMAELQMTVVTDPKSRQAIVKQIAQWEENLEKLYIDQYRFRCYSASLQGSELPNPKVLLACASKASKTTLGRLGIFTVTSFHALVSARKPLVLPNIYGKTSQKGGMLSPRSEVVQKPRSRTPTALVSSSASSEALFKTQQTHSDSLDNLFEKSGHDNYPGQESLSKVTLPNNQCYNFQTMLIGVDRGTSVQDLLEITCSKRQLNPRDHYVRIKPLGSTDNTFLIPDKHENIKKLRYDAIEVCQKCIFQMELTKPTKDGLFGFAVEAELADDQDRDDELRVYVCDVTKDGVADRRGLIVGDEILVINSKIVSELDMVYIETLLHESRSLFLTVRSMRTQPPRTDFIQKHTDAYINNMVVPPPPAQSRLSDRSLGNLIVPAPSADKSTKEVPVLSVAKDRISRSVSPAQIDTLLEKAEEVTAICRKEETLTITNEDGTVVSKPLSDAQRMRKAIMELVETERAYVKDLKCLTERYLEPLKEETFLTSGEIQQLFGNIQEIVAFQQRFLHSLEEAVESLSDFFTTNDASHFKRVLFSLGGSFLYYANHFKVYSSFCASHSRSQKILNPDANEALREFLRARNPKQQHSATLESYLIKPIQRILKYPLLLQQLCNMTNVDTDEHHHLSEALKGMEAVAEHINEMQKIYDEYGSVFDELSKSYKENNPHKPPIELNVGDLQMYGTVEWVNIADHMGKVKKSAEFENVVFVFKAGVTFLCRERLKRKRAKSLSTRSSLIEVSETTERFRTLIPTQEVQIRTGKVGDMDRHYWWDLVHSRSEHEGRPEKVYQFCNSTSEAKSDFMKVIRQTIRESVRKMIIPSSTHHHPLTSSRPYSTSPTHMALTTDTDCAGGISSSYPSPSSHPHPLSSPQLALFKRRMKSSDAERHSMDLDNKLRHVK
ncbi:protein still life, isoform SIF type 1-like isoform X3 [Biomphalaria glabrata]|uniref:Protein still life, isoform SIF type 1-like isoform X3 n=1 Tax=Biomphalaria glabrata TaxID=6526 RepID=A0A9W3AQN7_BIOGL|nr:protein still life, isoform SIF type 1-like isoform X3 [Biomphalaria glabrata]